MVIGEWGTQGYTRSSPNSNVIQLLNIPSIAYLDCILFFHSTRTLMAKYVPTGRREDGIGHDPMLTEEAGGRSGRRSMCVYGVVVWIVGAGP